MCEPESAPTKKPSNLKVVRCPKCHHKIGAHDLQSGSIEFCCRKHSNEEDDKNNIIAVSVDETTGRVTMQSKANYSLRPVLCPSCGHKIGAHDLKVGAAEFFCRYCLLYQRIWRRESNGKRSDGER